MPQPLGRPTTTGVAWSKPAIAIGDFIVLAGETLPRCFVDHSPGGSCWSNLVRGPGVDHPYACALDSLHGAHLFTLNIVLIEVGAGDLSGAGAALASVTQVGPVVTAIAVHNRPGQYWSPALGKCITAPA